jgi:hypothetical protein
VWTRRAVRALALCAVLAATAGCPADDDAPPLDADAPTAPGPGVDPDEPGAPADPGDPDAPPFEGAVEPVEARMDGGMAVVDGVRHARRQGYDRVVFDFRERRPGYRVEYVSRPVRECASGREVQVRGDAILMVRMHPAQGYEQAAGERLPTVQETDRRLDLPRILHLREVCNHLGTVEWVIGLAARGPYRVLALDGPPRLVVDVRD